MAQFSERELFETVPVPRAVATLAVPTVISHHDLQPGRHLLHRPDRGPADGGGGVPGVPLVQSAHRPGEPLRPGREQPDLPDAGGEAGGGDPLCVLLQHLGGGGGHRLLLPGQLPGPGTPAHLLGGQPRQLPLCGGLPAVGGGDRRRAHHGEPGPGPSAPQRGPRP